MRHCGHCGAPIFFAKHVTTTQRTPIDLDPVPGGSVIVLSGGYYYIATEVKRPATVARYTRHYQTCREAQQQRGRSEELRWLESVW